MSNITHPAVSEQLLVRIAAGDKAALAELYAQAKNPVYCFALSILRDSFAAEDVMQETFLQVWKSAPTYRPGGKKRHAKTLHRQHGLTWILGITKYTALARLREGQRAGIPLEDAADKVDPRDAFRDCENRIVTQAMLAQLAQDEREIVVLHVVTGLKHREIAELLEMPLPTVLSKYRRSLKKLERLVREPS